jgi:hypothetical protein
LYGVRPGFQAPKEKLWAWQWIWVVLVVVCLAMLVPLSIRETRSDFADSVANALNELILVGWTQFEDLVVSFAIRLILVSFSGSCQTGSIGRKGNSSFPSMF